MNALIFSLAILFIGIPASVSETSLDDLEAVLRRLAEAEAEQAKSRETINALRRELSGKTSLYEMPIYIMYRY